MIAASDGGGRDMDLAATSPTCRIERGVEPSSSPFRSSSASHNSSRASVMATYTKSPVDLQKEMREAEMPANEPRNYSSADHSKDWSPMPPNAGGRSIGPSRLSRA